MLLLCSVFLGYFAAWNSVGNRLTKRAKALERGRLLEVLLISEIEKQFHIHCVCRVKVIIFADSSCRAYGV